MDFMVAGALAPGGLALGAAVAGWMLGRRQSGKARVAPLSPVVDGMTEGEAPAPSQTVPFAHLSADANAASACQHAARAERREVIEAVRSLAELHDEITAYRRQERVLAATVGEGMPLELAADALRQECRYLGLIGQPTCSLPHGGHSSCTRSTSCPAPMCTVQPSAPASDFTRV